MAVSFNARRLAIQRKYDQRLTDEMRALGASMARVAARFAQGVLLSERVIPNTRRAREQVKRAVYDQVILPYFVGPSGEPFSDAQRTVPQSPFARLLFEGIQEMINLEVERQLSILRRSIKDEVVWQYLTEDRRVFGEIGPPPTNFYDPFHKFVYQTSTGQDYRLSDAVWDTAATTRDQVDKFFDYFIPRGLAAVDYEPLLDAYMTDKTTDPPTRTPLYLTERAAAVRTRRPYGTSGSYAARRLARTEITAAGGRAYINMAQSNPYIEGTKWNLSPAHPKADICDTYASGGPNGGGVYPNNGIPGYPAHPHCLCYLTPEVTKKPAEVTAAIRAQIDAVQAREQIPDREARIIRNRVAAALLSDGKLRGAFNQSWLGDALLYGDWIAKMAIAV